MARYIKLKLKTKQKYGLAPESDSIRRKSVVIRRKSAYGERLEQKQKLKYIYGVMERQMKRYAKEALSSKENSQNALLQKLESRLDNVVFRLGFSKTRAQARQSVNHGHIQVDGAKVDIPSYILKPGQKISLAAKVLRKNLVSSQIEINRKNMSPVSYLEYTENSGKFLSFPEKNDLAQNVDISKVMEFYHRLV